MPEMLLGSSQSSEEVRRRSCGYPLLDLAEAHRLLTQTLVRLGPEPFSRKDLAEALGYSNISGGLAARKISSLVQYGFLDSDQGELSLTQIAIRLREAAATGAETMSLLRIAVSCPALYRKLMSDLRPGGVVPANLHELLASSYAVRAKVSRGVASTFLRSLRYAEEIDRSGRFTASSRSEPHAPKSLEPSPATEDVEFQKPIELRATGSKRGMLVLPIDPTIEDLEDIKRRAIFELDFEIEAANRRLRQQTSVAKLQDWKPRKNNPAS